MLILFICLFWINYVLEKNLKFYDSKVIYPKASKAILFMIKFIRQLMYRFHIWKGKSEDYVALKVYCKGNEALKYNIKAKDTEQNWWTNNDYYPLKQWKV